MLTFWWRRRYGWEARLSDDVVRTHVDVFLPEADMLRIQKSLTNHVVSTFAAVSFAVGTKLTEWQGFRRRRYTQNSLTDGVVVAVVVVWWALVVGGRSPWLARYWLTKNVEAETLNTQLQIY